MKSRTFEPAWTATVGHATRRTWNCNNDSAQRLASAPVRTAMSRSQPLPMTDLEMPAFLTDTHLGAVQEDGMTLPYDPRPSRRPTSGYPSYFAHSPSSFAHSILSQLE